MVILLLLGVTGLWAAALAESDSGQARANRLQYETSPYLLLHAHNPVDWYPWGPEAFARARSEDKPIFLSVGYTTCYWCHVMERKVFANAEIAALMNEWFVNIKVDREERPDIDQIYMTATHLVNRSGGWPNSVFLTPELKPFFAGTYFPPEDYHGRPGFPRVLRALQEAWQTSRDEVEATAQQLTAAIRQARADRNEPMAPDTSVISDALSQIAARYDASNGGFGGAPKFPPAMRLDLLLDAWEEEGNERALKIVNHTLASMASGGIYDQIGGGFHRYSTDAKWRVPHFEKMLYNQAHLTRIYTRAYALTGDERWGEVARDILRYVDREMTSVAGGFYSALDAETDAVEGKYYVWTEGEIREALGDGAELFLVVYGLAPMPEGDEMVVYEKASTATVASEHGMQVSQLKEVLEKARSELLRVRQGREYPLLDDKFLTSWNGMMIAAYGDAYAVLKDETYRRTAEAAALFVMDRLGTASGGLKRVFRNNTVKYDGFLEDYAYFADGLLALYRATGETRWLRAAEKIADEMVERFWDEEDGGFFYTEGAGEDLIARSKNGQDSALPSANGVAVSCLLELARETGRRDFLDRAERSLHTFGGSMAQFPSGYTQLVRAANIYLKTDWDRLDAYAQEKSEESAAGPESGRLGVALPAISLAADEKAIPDSVLRVAVDVSQSLPSPGEQFLATVHLEIVEGWHVNANPAANEWLIPTSLTMNAELPLSLRAVDYPVGAPLFSDAFDETLSVYDGSVELRAEVVVEPEAVPGQEGLMRLLVQYQACDETRCLPPADMIEEVSLRIGDE